MTRRAKPEGLLHAHAATEARSRQHASHHPFGFLVRVVLLIAFFALLLAISSGTAHAQTISITFHQDPAGVAMLGSGTPSASMSLGNFQKFGGGLASGLTRTLGSNDWSVSTPMGLRVENSGVSSSSYTLMAELVSADLDHTWSVDSVTIVNGGSNAITSIGSYDVVESHTIEILIPDSSPAGALDNSIMWTAIAN